MDGGDASARSKVWVGKRGSPAVARLGPKNEWASCLVVKTLKDQGQVLLLADNGDEAVFREKREPGEGTIQLALQGVQALQALRQAQATTDTEALSIHTSGVVLGHMLFDSQNYRRRQSS